MQHELSLSRTVTQSRAKPRPTQTMKLPRISRTIGGKNAPATNGKRHGVFLQMNT
jgi:hypothetical protein